MAAEVIRVDPQRIDRGAIARAASIIRNGGLVAFPTETVYGLGANALDDHAVRRIFAAKGRPFDDPLIVHIARDWPLTTAIAPQAAPMVERITSAHWPGPLTIVAPRASTIAPSVSGGLETVAVRCPAHPVAAALLNAAGVPIAAPSANRFSYVSPTSAEHVLEDLGDRIEMVIDAGRTEHGIESTVAALDGSELVILRHGAVTLEALQATVGDLVRVRASSQEGYEARSPGRQKRHYSPRSPTVALRPSVLRSPVPDSLAAMSNVLYLGYEDRPPQLPTAWTFRSLGRLADLTTVAFDLYENLRRNDVPGADRVMLAELTEEAHLGTAIDDRLTRAAGGRLVSTGTELLEALAEIVDAGSRLGQPRSSAGRDDGST